MRWERLFDDLEAQAAAEWEAERALLDSESERLRVSRLTLRDRLLVLRDPEHRREPIRIDVDGWGVRQGYLVSVGVDWLGIELCEGPSELGIVTWSALRDLRMSHADLLASARPGARSEVPSAGLSERVALGFVLRDLARRRVALQVRLRSGGVVTGTVDRAGADHLDLAEHDAGVARHPDAVRAHRIIPFDVLSAVVVATTAFDI